MKRRMLFSAMFIAITSVLFQPAVAQGQVQVIIILMQYPRQTVEVLHAGETVKAHFQATIVVHSDGMARGTLHWKSRGDHLILRAVQGRGVFDSAGELERVELTFKGRDGERTVATVTPDPNIPGCDIWHFMGNGTQFDHDLSFDAKGRIVIKDRFSAPPHPENRR